MGCWQAFSSLWRETAKWLVRNVVRISAVWVTLDGTGIPSGAAQGWGTKGLGLGQSWVPEQSICLSCSPGFGPQYHRREELNHRKQGCAEGFREDLLSEPPLSHLSFHASPPFFLLFPFPHVLVLLFRFCHGLKKLIENPKELIWLDFASLFPKVLHRFSELEKKIWKKRPQCSKRTDFHHPIESSPGWSTTLTGGLQPAYYLPSVAERTSHRFPSWKLNIPDFWSHVPCPVISAQHLWLPPMILY